MNLHPQSYFCFIRKCELIHQVDDDDFLYRVVTPSVHQGALGSPSSRGAGEGVLQDFILLASKRKPCSSGSGKHKQCAEWSCRTLRMLLRSHFVISRDPYVIALRSVSLSTHPPAEGCNRGEVLCAGFTIQDAKDNKSLVKPTNISAPIPSSRHCLNS